MKKIKGFFKDFVTNESGQGMVEYILIVVLIAVAVLVVVGAFGDKIKAKFTDAGTALDKTKVDTTGKGGAGTT